jgi:predicted DNA-binding transcriptional regulator YafY
MAFSKSQMMRFRLLNAFFTSKKKKWTRKELEEKMLEHGIKVSRRTLTSDLDLMKNDSTLGYIAPIEYCKMEKRLFYSDSNYAIEKLPLSSSEYEALVNILSLIKFKDAFKDFDSIIDKLIRKGSERDISNIIGFEEAPAHVGEKHIDPLRTFIRGKQPIKVNYKKFTADKSSTYIVHPYYLKEYRNLWYLLCFYEEANELRTFALDRVIDIEAEEIEFIPSQLHHPEDYFRDIIGITRPKGEKQDIVLTFTHAISPYIKAQPLHQSQEILEENDEQTTIKLKIIPNYEFYSILLGYGKKLRSASPAFVLEEMMKI